MALKERLKEIRQDKGLKQDEMAERLGLSLGSIQRYEAGTGMPNFLTLVDLAQDGYNIHWLVTGDGEKFSWKNKNTLLAKIKRWLEEEEQKEPEIMVWFSVQFKKKFPEFKKWEEEKEESEAKEAYSTNRKVA